MEPWRTAPWNSLYQDRISHEALQFISISLHRGSHLDELSSVTGQGQMICFPSPVNTKRSFGGKNGTASHSNLEKLPLTNCLSFLARSTFYFLLVILLYKTKFIILSGNCSVKMFQMQWTECLFSVNVTAKMGNP